MMISLEIILSRFLSITTPLMKVGFGFLPIAVIAMLYGPLYSAAAWGISDLLGAVMFPVAPYFYGFTVSAIIGGALLGALLKGGRPKILNVAAAVTLSCCLVTLGLDTLWLGMITGTPYAAVAVARLIKCAVMMPLEFITITAVVKYTGEFIYKNCAVAAKKSELRNAAVDYYNGEFLTKRDLISETATEKLTSLPEYKKSETVFCFIGRDNEIDTVGLINKMIREGKTVAVPQCGKNGIMTAKRIETLEGLQKGRFGIHEPGENSELVPPERIDLTVIPSLLCDKKGRRIGYGGGYYDRYLSGNKRIKKIILCPKDMIKKRIPNAPFDLAADKVIEV